MTHRFIFNTLSAVQFTEEGSKKVKEMFEKSQREARETIKAFERVLEEARKNPPPKKVSWYQKLFNWRRS